MKRRTFVVSTPGRIDGALRDALQFDRDSVLAHVERGSVYLNGRRVKDAGTRVGPGQKVMVVLEEGGESVVAEAAAPTPALEILHEDQDVIAVNKAPGVVAQPTPGKVGDSLLDLVSAHLGYEAGLVHRLDRETSGVTVFGRNPRATSSLAAEFREGRAQKEYVAVVSSGIDAKGTIELPLSKDPSRPGRWRASNKANGIDALTHFERLSDDGEHAVVALFPQTGRTHQLRAHLTGIGFPILGDALYGGADAGRCLLHARKLDLPALNLSFEAPIPEDLKQFRMK
ncbi:MAG: RluA family pseudouridine synthase [Archangium sp.]